VEIRLLLMAELGLLEELIQILELLGQQPDTE